MSLIELPLFKYLGYDGYLEHNNSGNKIQSVAANQI